VPTAMTKEAHFTMKVLGYKIEDPGKADIGIFQGHCLLYSQINYAENTLHYAKFNVYVSEHHDKFVK
jgi:hypothetical protein